MIPQELKQRLKDKNYARSIVSQLESIDSIPQWQIMTEVLRGMQDDVLEQLRTAEDNELRNLRDKINMIKSMLALPKEIAETIKFYDETN